MDEFDACSDFDINRASADLPPLETEDFAPLEDSDYLTHVSENMDSMSHDELLEARDQLEALGEAQTFQDAFSEHIESMSLDALRAEREKLVEMGALDSFEPLDDTGDDDNPPVLEKVLRRR